MTKHVKSLLHYQTNNSNSNEASPVILLRQLVSATRLIPLLFIIESTFLETYYSIQHYGNECDRSSRGISANTDREKTNSYPINYLLSG